MKKQLLSLILLVLIISCNKKKSNPNVLIQDKQPELIKCDNLVGIWFCMNVDTIIKDSLVLEVDYYGFKNDKSYVQYKSNMPEFYSLLWHYCPYKSGEDDFHITYKNKYLTFRYFH